ncbi:hypothetical protein AB0K09_16500 [Streptomyces sp. NPDC049577]|uniref:hypothetical protein n=1 Tax=Streptomyces sp. NPDC049577 TaxID=3155153 RepID=UPI003418A8D2
MVRHASTLSVGLPPDEAVVVDAPAPELRPVLAAAASGDFRPVRELLAASRRDMQWELRDRHVAALAEFALHNPGWLDAWLDAAPDDPDAVLVKADLLVDQAWEIRGSARAEEVSREQFQGFFTLLEDAAPVIGAAAGLNPNDPVPWRIALTHARGSQAPREVFDEYWAEAVARSPHHFGCHATALQYLCEKWYGSHEEMFGFAERAAGQALPGSKLHALPMMAVLEYRVVADAGEDGVIAQARIDAAIERARELAAHYPPGDQEIAWVRNHLALLLAVQERFTEALDQLRDIGVHATEYPWGYLGDARREFLEFRTGVRMQVATRTPLLGRPPLLAPAPAAADGTPTAVPDWETDNCSLAIVSATLDTVAEATPTGPTLRLAPAADGWHTLVEAVRVPQAARRGTLLTHDRLVDAADLFTRSERWPALVLHRSGDRYGFTLLRDGKRVAEHQWDPAAPVRDLAGVTETAGAVAAVYGIADSRPLIALLRGSDDAPRRQAELIAAIGLPPLPPAFGQRTEALTDLPGARILAGRGVRPGPRGADGAGGAAANPAYSLRRPWHWWALRLLFLPVVSTAAVYGWMSDHVFFLKPLIATASALYVASQLVTAWRRRPRRGA